MLILPDAVGVVRRRMDHGDSQTSIAGSHSDTATEADRVTGGKFSRYVQRMEADAARKR